MICTTGRISALKKKGTSCCLLLILTSSPLVPLFVWLSRKLAFLAFEMSISCACWTEVSWYLHVKCIVSYIIVEWAQLKELTLGNWLNCLEYHSFIDTTLLPQRTQHTRKDIGFESEGDKLLPLAYSTSSPFIPLFAWLFRRKLDLACILNVYIVRLLNGSLMIFAC